MSDDTRYLLASGALPGVGTLHPDRNFDSIACVVGRERGGFSALARLAFGDAWMPLTAGQMCLLDRLARCGERCEGDAHDTHASDAAVPDILEVRRTLGMGMGTDGRLRVEPLRAWLAGNAARDAAGLRAVLNGGVGPYLCRPLQMGADVVIESVGLPGVAAIAVARTERTLGRFANALAARLADVPDVAGGACHDACAQDDALLAGMLPTLSACAQRCADTALAVAHYLSMHPSVAWVSYPGLPGDAANDAARRTLEHGFGPLVAFGLHEEAPFLVDAATLPADGLPAGDGTLSTLFRTPSAGAYLLSTGLEDVLDVVGALESALAGARG